MTHDVTADVAVVVAGNATEDVAVYDRPDVKPDVTPDVTPHVSPDVAPDVTPDVAPAVYTADTKNVTTDVTPMYMIGLATTGPAEV